MSDWRSMLKTTVVVVTFFVLAFAVSAQAQDGSGLMVWGDASSDATDTGDELCTALEGVTWECQAVFVYGGATVYACTEDMTVPASSTEDKFYALCN